MENQEQAIKQSVRRLQWFRYGEGAGVLFALELIFIFSRKKIKAKRNGFTWH